MNAAAIRRELLASLDERFGEMDVEGAERARAARERAEARDRALRTAADQWARHAVVGLQMRLSALSSQDELLEVVYLDSDRISEQDRYRIEALERTLGFALRDTPITRHHSMPLVKGLVTYPYVMRMAARKFREHLKAAVCVDEASLTPS